MRIFRLPALLLCAVLLAAGCAEQKDETRHPQILDYQLTSGLDADDPLIPGDFVNVEAWVDDPEGLSDVDSSKVFFFDGYLWIRLERDPVDRGHFRATHDIPCPDYRGPHLGAVKIYDKHGLSTKEKFTLYYDTSCSLCNAAPELGQVYVWVNGTLDEQMTYSGRPVDVFDFDELGVTFDYNDRDCNLSGGEFWYRFDSEQWQVMDDLLPDWLACSSEQSCTTYGLRLPTETVGEHTWQVYWEDECGAHSNQRTGSYTVSTTE